MRIHMIQLCVHCRNNPAGFWVYVTGHETTRRPWCLGCAERLDKAMYTVERFKP